MVEELDEGVDVQVVLVVVQVDNEGGRSDVKCIHLVGLAELGEVLDEVLLVAYFPMVLEVVVAEGALVHHVELHQLRGLGPLEMHQRKLVVLHPHLPPVEGSPYQLVVVSLGQVIILSYNYITLRRGSSP